MAEFRDQTITTKVALDGNSFVNCQFDGAEVTYAGGEAPTFDNCRFDQTKFTFSGPAKNTVAFLRIMAPAKTNMRSIVLGLVPELQS